MKGDENGKEKVGVEAAEAAGRVVSATPGVDGGVTAGPSDRTQGMGRAILESLLEARLSASGLPELARDQVRRAMAARAGWGPAELDGEIGAIRTFLGRLAEDRVIQGAGSTGVRAGLDPMDRVQLAADRLLGADTPGSASGVPRLSGIRELYFLLSGDQELSGLFQPDRVSMANVTTSTMTSVVKNSLSKAMLKAFDARPKWWEPVVAWADRENLQDVTLFRTNAIGDLDAVTEGDAYTEKAWGDYEETASFTKYGNYVGVTLEMIANDDVDAVRRIPRELANAAYKTLSTLVSNVFTANGGAGPTLATDSKALFHVDHGNLGTAALGADSFGAARWP